MSKDYIKELRDFQRLLFVNLRCKEQDKLKLVNYFCDLEKLAKWKDSLTQFTILSKENSLSFEQGCRVYVEDPQKIFVKRRKR